MPCILNDFSNDKNISEAMLGRAFAIRGINCEELGDDQKARNARIVVEGSNIRTTTCPSAANLFKNVSNAPASLAAARAALAVAAMEGFFATLRDAETACLQALIDTPTRSSVFVELP